MFLDIWVCWKNPKKIYKKSVFRKLPPVQRGATGQPGGCLARPSSWPRHLPSWVGPTSPGALLWPYLFSRRRNPRTEVAFSIYVAEPPQPSVLLGELIWRLLWPP